MFQVKIIFQYNHVYLSTKYLRLKAMSYFIPIYVYCCLQLRSQLDNVVYQHKVNSFYFGINVFKQR